MGRLSKARFVQEYVMTHHNSDMKDIVGVAEALWNSLTEVGYGDEVSQGKCKHGYDYCQYCDHLRGAPKGATLVNKPAFVDDGLHQGYTAEWWRINLNSCGAFSFVETITYYEEGLASAKRRDENLRKTGGK